MSIDGIRLVDDLCLDKDEWMEFLADYKALGTKSEIGSEDKVFLVILDGGLSLFYQKNNDAKIFVWEHDAIEE